MGYVAPTTRATGYLVPASVWNSDVVDNVTFLANPPACRVYHNTTQSIPHNALTTLAFNSERYDTDTMHDTVTNNSRITIRTAGLYVVTLGIELASATDYTRMMAALYVNATTYIAITEVGTTTQSDVHRLAVSTTYKFAANDYIEAQAQHVNAAVAARNATAGANYAPEFSATWVGLG